MAPIQDEVNFVARATIYASRACSTWVTRLGVHSSNNWRPRGIVRLPAISSASVDMEQKSKIPLDRTMAYLKTQALSSHSLSFLPFPLVLRLTPHFPSLPSKKIPLPPAHSSKPQTAAPAQQLVLQHLLASLFKPFSVFVLQSLFCHTKFPQHPFCFHTSQSHTQRLHTFQTSRASSSHGPAKEARRHHRSRDFWSRCR